MTYQDCLTFVRAMYSAASLIEVERLTGLDRRAVQNRKAALTRDGFVFPDLQGHPRPGSKNRATDMTAFQKEAARQLSHDLAEQRAAQARNTAGARDAERYRNRSA